MEYKGIVIQFLFLVLTNAALGVEMDMYGDWKPNFGWELTCVWTIPMKDRLHSVNLYHDDRQFMKYRPEDDGANRTAIYTPLGDKYTMRVDCHITVEQGHRGRCLISVEPFVPLEKDMRFTCEVSGEAPQFRVANKEFIIPALVSPSDAELVVNIEKQQSPGRVTLNCSSIGLPAPNLIWTVGDHKDKADFSGSIWNSTTKLMHSWSTYTIIPPSDESLTVRCVPEVIKNNAVLKGEPAEYTWNKNNACGLSGNTKIEVIVLILLRLLR